MAAVRSTRIRDRLYRLRPATAPAGPSASGVPADRAFDAATELQPVLELLSGTEDECRRLVDEATRQAAQLREEAHQLARQIRANAAEQALAERAGAAAAITQQGADEAAALSETAQLAAQRLTARAETLLPEYVAAVLDSAGLR